MNYQTLIPDLKQIGYCSFFSEESRKRTGNHFLHDQGF